MDVFKYAKEVNFKRNDDRTFQMNVKMDLYDSDGQAIRDADFTYSRIKVNNFDHEVLEIPYNHELFNVKV